MGNLRKAGRTISPTTTSLQTHYYHPQTVS